MESTNETFADKMRRFAIERVDTDAKKNGLMNITARKAEIATALSNAAYFIGIIQPIGQDMLNLLVRFTMEHFSYFSGEKIEIAFDLAVAGKLEECKIEHFQSFSGIYISRIFKAFEKLENRYIADYKREKEAAEVDEKKDVYDPVEGAREWAETVLDYADKLTDANFDSNVVWPKGTVKESSAALLFKYISGVGIINDSEVSHDDFRHDLAIWCVNMKSQFTDEIGIANELESRYQASAIENVKN